MVKKLLAILLVLTMIGTATAAPAVDIQTSTESAAAGNILTVYQGVDSCDASVDLKAHYTDWDTSVAEYKVKVWDTNPNPDVLVYSNPSGASWGSIDTDPKDVGICWTPAYTGDGRYRIVAEGNQEGVSLEAYARVSTRPDSIPELPASVLTLVGLIGLVGLVRFKKY